MFEGNINLLSSYDTTDKVNTSSLESRKLTTGILKSKESRDYSLRLWIDYNTTLEDLNNEIKSFKSKIVVVGKPINYTGDTVFNFDYTGAEQIFTAPVSGTYKLETWGAQGGSTYDYYGGYGGYSSGAISLTENDVAYINIGGSGQVSSEGIYGGYNGGGSSNKNWGNFEISRQGSGGGGSLDNAGGGGGSGYIGNSLLKDKVMYCYNCEESNEESTKTISTTCNEETPTSYCAKKGNGYARITLVSVDK